MSAASKKDALMTFMVKDGERWSEDKSVLKFREAYRSFIAKHEAHELLIKDCMQAVFAQFPSAFLNTSYICSQVITRMGQQVPELKNPTLHTQLSKRITEVLHAEEAVGVYVVRKGPGGGFQATTPIGPPADVPRVMS